MKNNPLALIFSTVWPEPNSSAAGVRQFHWIYFLRRQGFRVILTSPSKLKNEGDWGSAPLPKDVEFLPLPLNDSSVRETLRELNPQLILFDRFILEEQFGHFIYETCPAALVLIETQDLHLVRKAREEQKEVFLKLKEGEQISYHTDTALRETAAIMRADYSFVVSSFEEKLLLEQFQLGSEHVKWLPFFYEEPVVQASYEKSFSERSDFVWIGNFRHAPNGDGLRFFRNQIWPKMKKKIPEAKLRIYGAYPSKEVMEWHDPKGAGVMVLGSAKSLDEVFSNARVNLAPLRFGAGIKGKILEGFRFGVPVVTTKVGVEGILPGDVTEFPGIESNTEEGLVEASVTLYQDEKLWNQKREQAKTLMLQVYDAAKVERQLAILIEALFQKKEKGTLPRWNSKVLRHELFNSHKYFSQWIEAKNQKR